MGLGITAAVNTLTKELGQGASVWKLAALIGFQALLLL